MSDEITMLREKLAAAERFKDFCHSYLDAHGIPHGDPDNPRQKEGCRIGARLDLLFAQRDSARAAAVSLAGLLAKRSEKSQ